MRATVVTSLGVVHDLGFLQSPLIQINPHDALELGGLSRIVGTSILRKATLEACPSLVPLHIACTSLSCSRLGEMNQFWVPAMTLWP